MSKNVTAPADKARLKVYREMTPELKKVAKDGAERLGKTSSALAIVYYDLGARLKKVYADEATYGSSAAEQLAAYWAIPGGATTLYHMKNIAERFDRDFVGEKSAQEMADGSRLTFNHWMKLAQIKDEKYVEPLLNKCFKHSYSVKELEAAIVEIGAEKTTKRAAGAGRKQSTPKSPIAGLQKAFSQAQSFTNFVPVLEKSVFSTIDTMSPDSVDDILLTRLKDTAKQVTKMRDGADATLKHIEKNIERVERVLAKKKEKAEQAAKEEKAEKQAEKKAKGAKAKKGKKDKGKKKRRTPVEV